MAHGAGEESVNPAAGPPIPLSDAPCGRRLYVSAILNDAERCRLSEMGVFEGRILRVMSAADPVICALEHGRLGIARRLADQIMVRRASGRSG